MEINVLTIIYLVTAVTFIIGLKMLSNPATARRGNLIAAAGMTIAILGTIFLYKDDEGNNLHNYGWIFGGIVIGGIIGTLAAKKVKMTAMPEMVSMFNGMGGACAALISIVEFNHLTKLIGYPPDIFISNHHTADHNGNSITNSFIYSRVIIILLGLIIGSVSFAGSMIAWGKLNGRIKDITFKGQHIFNLTLLFLIFIAAIALIFFIPLNPTLFFLVFAGCLAYGVLFVLPIGGADMPVVISLLNSFTGVAAACGGFLYDNKVMLTGGILVGAAGTLLTILMCRAMNRSLKNVLIGNFGGSTAAGVKGQAGTYKEISPSDTAMAMSYGRKVMIVPGYGLAVAQAQHVCEELGEMLEDRGVEVKYAIHPVAGRMPGHMNVLLAEADVSYDKLLEMEQANDEFKTTDVVLVLGANDVVNPAAKTDPASPIYGMPILEVEDAKMVVVNKRSMKPGYAGIENELFFKPKTSMLFGDAKSVLQQLISEVKTL